LESFGLVSIENEQDLEILAETVDKDKDGLFSFTDFLNSFPSFEY
jgi:hypothetical protein